MRRRFYAPPEAFAPDGASVVLSEEESRHLRDVLRLRAGDEAFVFDGEGREFACVVRGVGGRGAALEVRGRVPPPSPESPLELTLAVALLKGEKFDLVVQKAAELGAARVLPVETRRSDVRLRDRTDAARRVGRWRSAGGRSRKQVKPLPPRRCRLPPAPASCTDALPHGRASARLRSSARA